MNHTKEKIKLDEILKFLFSTSHKVLINLLNGVFEESLNADDVELTITSNEFIDEDLGVYIGDMFFSILKSNSEKLSYHLEFQTKNDNTMVIRMFEYGYKKGKQESKTYDNVRTIYFPKQKVMFFEENKNIEDVLSLKIVFPNNKEVLYTVDVLKYWELTQEYIIENKMYPLLPLQLFGLRKQLEKAQSKNDTKRLKELTYIAKKLAIKLAHESKEIFDNDEILGEDFHKMLLAIQNLIEYLNVNYLQDDNIEKEVITMTKSLYDPEVEKKGLEQGLKQGIKQGAQQEKIETVIRLNKLGLTIAQIAQGADLNCEEVKKILKSNIH